jgi:DNA-binding CsgD family transcriptional regulator
MMGMDSALLEPEVVPVAGSLNVHQRQLLDWLAASKTNAQIGHAAGRSEKTVRNQLTRVYAKLYVCNRAQAVALHLRMQFETRRKEWRSTDDGVYEEAFRDIRPIGYKPGCG